MDNKISKIYREKEYVFKFCFILLCFSIMFLGACVQPFNSCPDEGMRYVIPQYIYEHNHLPNANDVTIIDERYGFSYASQPMLPYIISALFMKVSYLTSGTIEHLIMAARMTSVLAGVGYVIFVMKIAKIAFEKVMYQWLFISLCSLWPQALFVFTYVNCDGVALFAVSVIVYFWFKIWGSGWNPRNCLGLSIGLSIGLLSYLNVYIYAISSVLIYICYFVFVDTSKDKCKRFFKYAFLICGFVLLFAGWHFIRNMVLYDGNILARGVNNFGEMYAIEGFSPSERAEYATEYLKTFSGNVIWIFKSAWSFIGVFGWCNIYLSAWSYICYFLLIMVGILSLFFYAKKTHLSLWHTKYILHYGLVFTSVAVVCISYIFSWSDFQPQGRYVLPALIPLCYCITLGFSKIRQIIQVKRESILFMSVLIVNFAVILDAFIKIYNYYY